MAWLHHKRGVYFVAWREAGRGSPIYYQRVGPNKRDALKTKTIIEARCLDGKIGGGVVPQKVLFKEYTENWLKTRTVREKTMDRDKRLLRVHLLPALGNSPLHTIRPEQIATLVAHLSEEVNPQTNRPKIHTARRAFALLSKMLNDAMKRDYLRENPVRKIDKPRLPHCEMKLLSVEEVVRLVAAVAPRWRPLVFVGLLTGLRWGELAALEWDDIDHNAGKLYVRRAIPANTKQVTAPKTQGSYRAVDLLPPVQQALLDMPRRSRLVFPADRGGYLNHRMFHRHVWKPTVLNLRLKSRFRFHDLRHTFASLLFAWGEQALYVAQQLGHSSVNVTLGIYGHLMREGRRLDKDLTLSRLWKGYCGAYPVLTSGANASSEELSIPAPDAGAAEGIRTPDPRITSAGSSRQRPHSAWILAPDPPPN